MTVSEYLSDHSGTFLLHLTGMAALSVFLLATGTAPGILAIILLAWLTGLITAHMFAFWKERDHLRELNSIIDSLDQKYLFIECAPIPKRAYERRLFSLLRRSAQSMTGAVSDARASQRDYREYVESWVHEIKTPITAAQLICRNADSNTRRKLQPELAQIETHVERALFYARAESPEQDFVVRKAMLSDIAAQALNNCRALLLQSGVRVETENLELPVYTDEKWTAFLLGQLLQNAARYRRENPNIRLSARLLGRQVQLSVADNGIGIPAHELPRIFDRGFTGRNGRSRSGATGMGLYISRRLAEFLQIDLAVSSSEGNGTCFTLTFPSQDNLS